LPFVYACAISVHTHTHTYIYIYCDIAFLVLRSDERDPQTSGIERERVGGELGARKDFTAFPLLVIPYGR